MVKGAHPSNTVSLYVWHNNKCMCFHTVQENSFMSHISHTEWMKPCKNTSDLSSCLISIFIIIIICVYCVEEEEPLLPVILWLHSGGFFSGSSAEVTPIFQHPSYQLLPFSNIPIIHCYHISTFQLSIVTIFQHSNNPLLPFSNIPIIHCYHFPTFQ